jgi:hypothetical protein
MRSDEVLQETRGSVIVPATGTRVQYLSYRLPPPLSITTRPNGARKMRVRPETWLFYVLEKQAKHALRPGERYTRICFPANMRARGTPTARHRSNRASRPQQAASVEELPLVTGKKQVFALRGPCERGATPGTC